MNSLYQQGIYRLCILRELESNVKQELY